MFCVAHISALSVSSGCCFFSRKASTQSDIALSPRCRSFLIFFSFFFFFFRNLANHFTLQHRQNTISLFLCVCVCAASCARRCTDYGHKPRVSVPLSPNTCLLHLPRSADSRSLLCRTTMPAITSPRAVMLDVSTAPHATGWGTMKMLLNFSGARWRRVKYPPLVRLMPLPPPQASQMQQERHHLSVARSAPLRQQGERRKCLPRPLLLLLLLQLTMCGSNFTICRVTGCTKTSSSSSIKSPSMRASPLPPHPPLLRQTTRRTQQTQQRRQRVTAARTRRTRMQRRAC